MEVNSGMEVLHVLFNVAYIIQNYSVKEADDVDRGWEELLTKSIGSVSDRF